MAFAPAHVVDTFSRTLTDTWGSTDSGHDWENENSAYDVDGSAGTISVPANATYRLVHVPSPANQDTAEVLCRIMWQSGSAAPITDFGPALRATLWNTFYYVTLQDNYDEIAIGVYVNGSRFELRRGSKTLPKDQWHWVRFRADGAGLKVKVWRDNAVEPSTWTLSSNYFDGNNPPGAGDGGIYTRGTVNTYTVKLESYYYYTLEDEFAAPPVRDTFTRVVSSGWGRSDSGHLWEGNLADSPDAYTFNAQGSVVNNGGIDHYGLKSDANQNVYHGFIGGPISGDVETKALVSFVTGSNDNFIYVGLRGAMAITNGVTDGSGYQLRLIVNSGTVELWRRAVGVTTVMATGASGVTLATSTKYWAKIQVVGTTVRGRVWEDGTTEPGTWAVSSVDGSPITSGRCWIAFHASATIGTNRSARMYDLTFGGVTSNNSITTDTVTTGTITDTTIAWTANYTADDNQNSSVTVEYRGFGDIAWTTFGGSITTDRTNHRFTGTLTGLTANRLHEIRVTFVDGDGVAGTNPRTVFASTTQLGVDIVSASTVVGNAVAASTPFQDLFAGTNGQAVTARVPNIGSTWVRHPEALTGTFRVNGGRAYADTATTSPTDVALFYAEPAAPTSEYVVSASLYVAANAGFCGILGRVDPAQNTYYHARYNTISAQWELYKNVANTVTMLGTYAQALTVGQTYAVDFICYDHLKAVEINGVRRITSADNAIVTGTHVGIRADGVGVGSATNQLTIDSFVVNVETSLRVQSAFRGDTNLNVSAVAAYRLYGSGGLWTNAETTMREDRLQDPFALALTLRGLLADTLYEVRVTYADADGVRGTNNQIANGQTIGRSVEFVSVLASAQETTAILTALYRYDTNNDSSLAIQYRSVMDMLWTTVPPNAIAVNRLNKQFTTTLTGLRPATTYEVTATISDPNGLMIGTPATISTTFTSRGNAQETVRRPKHYVWKIYDADGAYMGTWPDAPDPEFAAHENGGVSDMTVVLHRPLTDLHRDGHTIDFQHEVHVWAIDAYSDGFGPNLSHDAAIGEGRWTLATSWAIDATGGPDGALALKFSSASTVVRTVRSEIIAPESAIPVVFKTIARARGGKLKLYVEAYDVNDVVIDQSDDYAETVGPAWQVLRVQYTPPSDFSYMRVCAENVGAGTMWLDDVTAYQKELLIYRGRIESYTPSVSQQGESVSVQVLGLVSLLSDDYIEFLQFHNIQPANDQLAQRPHFPPADPADILKAVIDQARKQNPRCALHYTTESIRSTGELAEYTFRDEQLRSCFDKIRGFCPPDWHYLIEPNGLVSLRGPEHAPIYPLRIGVEIMQFEVERSIRNLKNYIHVKGRQDEDESEPDGFGSIDNIIFDQASIDKYGKRMLFIRDAKLTTPDMAEMVGRGRLVEYNREEQRATCAIPDEKGIEFAGGALRGDNIEKFRPGDLVRILDPMASDRNTYWDQFQWDQDPWDNSAFVALPDAVPIKTVQYHPDHVTLELSERQPSATSDFGRLVRWLQQQDADSTA